MIYVFGEYELDTDGYELRRTGKPLRIEPKAFDLLAYLVRQRGRAVAKDELFKQLWPNQFVTDDALIYCIMTARRALGDSGRVQRLIKTVHGRGYRFVAPVKERLQEPCAPAGGSIASVTGVSTAERRQLVVLCCRMAASPAHVEYPGPEDLGAVVQEAHTVCLEVIRRFAGHIAQYASDGLTAYFGYPRAHEDDAQRAVRTGLGIVEEVEQRGRRLRQNRGLQLAVHIGIHTGSMVVGALRKGVQGELPHVASWLQGLAG